MQLNCDYCGKEYTDRKPRSGKLNAHHLKSWKEYPELRYDISNGITLCIECHAKRHPKLRSLILSRL